MYGQFDTSMPPAGGLAGLTDPPTLLAPAVRVEPPKFAWGTRVILPLALLVALGGMLGYAARGALLPAEDVRVVPVVMQSSRRAPAAGAVVAQATGWVEPDPYAVVVNALTDGIVREVLVLEGDRVEADQPVARLIDEDARLAVAASEAELARASAEANAAQRRWENPTDRRQDVEVAGARVRELEAELEALEPTIEAEAARVIEFAELYALAERTGSSGASSETELITARQRLAAQRAVLAATKARRPVLESQISQARAVLTAAQENERLRIEEEGALGIARAEVLEAQARRDEAQLRLDRMTVRAPSGGVVMTRHAQTGAKVLLGMDDPLSAAIVRLFDPQRLQVRADVPLADAAKVGVGMEAEVIVSVLPDRVFRGHVTRVVNEADVARNTLQVKVAILDPDPQLKPEMLARVRFLAPASDESGGDSSQATSLMPFIAESLVFQHGGASAVLVVDKASKTASIRHIQLGRARKEGWVEVTSGLSPGDQVIADTSIRDGQRIRVVGEAELEQGGNHGVH